MGTFRRDPDGFTAKGASLSDLFETCGQALISYGYDSSIVGFEREVAVGAEAGDIDELLGAWLAEVRSLPLVHGFVPGDLLVVEVGEVPNRRGRSLPMQVRGTARGRTAGEWLGGVPDLPQVAQTPAIQTRRRTFTAAVQLSRPD